MVEQLALFDVEQLVEAKTETEYRVLVEGEQVGQGGCGLTVWAESEDDAIRMAHEEAKVWPGQKVAHVDRIDITVTGPRKADRKWRGMTRIRSIYWRGDSA